MDEYGNRSNICINKNAIPAHIGHGDWAGPCIGCGQNISAPMGNGAFKVAEGLEMELVPNPAGDKVNISLSGVETGEAMLTVYDQLGRLVFEQKMADGEQNIELQLKQFATGNYFVRVVSVAGNVTKKLVISR